MRCVRDERLTYTGYHKRPAWCNLRVYVEPGQRAVAILTELPDNPGASVTNCAEHLATLVATIAALEYKADGDTVVMIEHYTGLRGERPDTALGEHYSRVQFEGHDRNGTFRKPKWSPITRDQVEELIGQALPVGAAR